MPSFNSELRSATHSTAGHEGLLQVAHGLESLNLPHGAVLEAALLVGGELTLAETLHAVREAALDHLELHLHLGLHLQLVHHAAHGYCSLFLQNQIIRVYN